MHVSIDEILAEVNQHDFYVAHYVDLVGASCPKVVLEQKINQLAKCAGLNVLFNHTHGVCIFERQMH